MLITLHIFARVSFNQLFMLSSLYDVLLGASHSKKHPRFQRKKHGVADGWNQSGSA